MSQQMKSAEVYQRFGYIEIDASQKEDNLSRTAMRRNHAARNVKGVGRYVMEDPRSAYSSAAAMSQVHPDKLDYAAAMATE